MPQSTTPAEYSITNVDGFFFRTVIKHADINLSGNVCHGIAYFRKARNV